MTEVALSAPRWRGVQGAYVVRKKQGVGVRVSVLFFLWGYLPCFVSFLLSCLRLSCSFSFPFVLVSLWVVGVLVAFPLLGCCSWVSFFVRCLFGLVLVSVFWLGSWWLELLLLLFVGGFRCDFFSCDCWSCSREGSRVLVVETWALWRWHSFGRSVLGS